MLKCREVHHHASDYIEGNCSWSKRLQIKMHVMMCRHCYSFMKKLRLTRKVIARIDLKSPENRAKKIDQIMEKLDKQV